MIMMCLKIKFLHMVVEKRLPQIAANVKGRWQNIFAFSGNKIESNLASFVLEKKVNLEAVEFYAQCVITIGNDDTEK
jgi:hypothetical protein